MSTCSRKGCSIISERTSDKYGNICEGCFDELSFKGIYADIREFLDSHKKFKTVTPKDYFTLVFPSPNERH